MDCPGVIGTSLLEEPRISARGSIVCELSVGFSLFFLEPEAPVPLLLLLLWISLYQPQVSSSLAKVNAALLPL